jgi:hypothetical protein
MVDRRTLVLYTICAIPRRSCFPEGVMAQSADGASQSKFIDARTVSALDAMIGRAVAAAPDGHFQIWLYAQVERGAVRQVGMSPFVGESVRFSDRGRGRF